MMKLPLCGVVTTALLAWQPAGQLFEGFGDGAFRVEVRILPEEHIVLPRLEELSKDFLVRSASSTHLATLSVFPSSALAAWQTNLSCETYRQWTVYFGAPSRSRLVCGYMVAINGDAVIRVRSAEGKVIRRVVSGSDPTEFAIGRAVFEILFVSGRVTTKFDPTRTAGLVEPLLYVKTKAHLDEALCERATSLLAAKLGLRRLSVHYRNDSWFICDGGFPTVYPFSADDEPPPSEAEFYRSVSFGCDLSGSGAPACIQISGAPLGRSGR